MVLPSNNSSYEKKINKMLGYKNFKDRKPIIKILLLTYLLVVVIITVVNMFNIGPDLPYPVIFFYTLCIFVLTFALEGFLEKNKSQLIIFLTGGIILVILTTSMWWIALNR